SGGRRMVGVLVDCGDGFLRGTWFNQAWILGKLSHDDAVLFSGKPKRRAGRWEMTHPRVQSIDDDDLEAHGGLLPKYALTDGLTMDVMRRIAREAVERFVEHVVDPLPSAWRERFQVTGLAEALTCVHRPTTLEEFHRARRRLVFDDLVEFQLAMALRRRAWKQSGTAPLLPLTAKIDSRIRLRFPFQFTAGQERAIEEIVADLGSEQAMHRLLQADVGAGKTAVAVYVMLVAVAAGQQTVLMAPTELLARQHWQTIESLLEGSRVERMLLTGRLRAPERTAALESIAAGDVQLVVGTHAVIQEDVRFRSLGLAVIDEQHKFGVVQRSRFSDAETTATPHVLVMTATPIPRSICLTQFGDLDATVIDDLPPGRQPVVTSVIRDETTREQAWQFVRGQVESGRQAFVVCPRIDASEETGEGMGVEQTWQRLQEQELSGLSVGIVHGRLDAEAKVEAMDAFRDGRTHVLVATTVVEVGVDVPNATLMVVYQAERFGLSQLHQLRGRIGRGAYQGYCFLMAGREDESVAARLEVLDQHADGFSVAEADFLLRGPGDVLGVRQHGDLPLRVADLVADRELLEETRTIAFDLVRTGEIDCEEAGPLHRRVLERFGKLMELPQTG
ncbi:MAG: ATP-dependent DNA helicase RecG, partial [Planctomycetaceae bacterium]|nr:ATP-dependent DNA helicase RecG [Planctomycetaceae bacterium]